MFHLDAWQYPPDGRPLGGSELRSCFRPLWTKVYYMKYTCAEVSVVCNAVFRLTMSCCVPRRYSPIMSRTCAKSRRNFDVSGPPNFAGKGPPKFLTEFYKYGSQSNMWQSLVTIGQATSEIRRQNERSKLYSGETEWPAASIAGGRP